jgi:putative aldouronate transport system substrate-binding protein
MFTPEAQALTQMGREGIEYTLDDRGLPVFNDEWKKAIADGTQAVVYNPWFYLGGSELVESVGRIATTPPELCVDAYTIMRDRYVNKPWIKAAQPVGSSSDEKIIFDKINELRKTYEARMVLAKTEDEFESLYNEYVTNAETTGIVKLQDFMSENIKAMMPMFQ